MIFSISERHETLSFARESKQYLFIFPQICEIYKPAPQPLLPQYNLIYLTESGRSRDQPLQGSPSRRGCGGPCLRGWFRLSFVTDRQ